MPVQDLRLKKGKTASTSVLLGPLSHHKSTSPAAETTLPGGGAGGGYCGEGLRLHGEKDGGQAVSTFQLSPAF